MVLVLAICFMAGICVSAHTREAEYSLMDLYDYDYSLSLNSETVMVRSDNEYELYEVEYDSAWDTRVTGTLMLPVKGVPPYPCAVFVDGVNGDKTDLEQLYTALAREELCVLVMNARYHETQVAHNYDEIPGKGFKLRNNIISTVIDLRRAVMFLGDRLDLNTDRIVMSGRGAGAVAVVIAATMEKHVSASVMVDPILGMEAIEQWVVGNVLPQGINEEIRAEIKDILNGILIPVNPSIHLEGGVAWTMVSLWTGGMGGESRYESEKMIDCARVSGATVGISTKGTMLYDDIAAWIKKGLEGDGDNWDPGAAHGERDGIDTESECEKHKEHEWKLSSAQYYGYEKGAVKLTERIGMDAFSTQMKKHKINYPGPNGVRNEIVVNVPEKGVSPYPVLIYVHSEHGRGEDADIMAEILARNGVATVNMDMYWAKMLRRKWAFDSSYGRESVLRQGVLEILTAMDMLDQVTELESGEYTLYGEGIGAEVAINAAMMDERAKYIVIKDVNMGKDSQGVEGGVEDLIRTVESLNSKYILAIDTRKGAANNATVAGELYRAAKEPKESVVIEEDDPAIVSKLMKSVVVFMKNVETMSETLKVEDLNRRVSVSSELLDMASGLGHDSEDSYETWVGELNIDNVRRGGAAELVIKVRIRGVEREEATVAAIMTAGNGSARYVQLMDNGMGADPRAGDGEYSGIIRDSGLKTGQEFKVRVGGVGRDGGDIKGMEKSKKFVTH